MNKNNVFSSSTELVAHAAKQFRFLLFFACVLLLAITLLSVLVNRSLSQLVELDTILRKQSNIYENLSRNITLASKLNPTKSVSVFKKVNDSSLDLLASLRQNETRAAELLENKSSFLNFIFDEQELQKHFKLKPTELSAVERLIDTMKNEKILLGINNITYLRPVEVSIVSRRPWAVEFTKGNILLENGLTVLSRSQSFVTIASAVMLMVSTVLIYYFTFRPSFNYLRSTLESREEANKFRHGIVSLVTQHLDIDPEEAIVPTKAAEKLTAFARENEMLDSVEFVVGADGPSLADKYIVSEIGLNPHTKDHLMVKLPEHLMEFKSTFSPYLDIISQNLRLQNELVLRHEVESERDKALNLVGPLLESFPYPIMVTDDQSKIVLSNPAACELFELDSVILNGQVLESLKKLHAVIATGTSEVKSIDNSEDDLSTEIFRYSNGKTLQWQSIELMQEKRRIYVAQDLTQLLKSMSEKEHLRKMEVLGKISGTISHDTNNFLAVIRSALEILSKNKVVTGKNQELVDMALKSCQNASNLNRQLVGFSQKLDLQPQVLRISELKNEITGYKDTSFADVKLVWRIKDDPEILVDPTNLTSSIINLIRNSGTAMDGLGKMQIFTSITSKGELKIRVSDNGPGFSEDELRNAVEPFYSNSRMGTGLGLSSVDGFVRQSGGYIKLSNDNGAIVDIFLPLSKDLKKEKGHQSIIQKNVKTNNGSNVILLIEDNKNFGDLLEEYLTDVGYEIVRLENVRMGKTTLEKHINTKFCAVVADLVLPDGNGVTLVNKMLENSEKLPVILMTGYGDQIIQREAPEFEFQLLSKPFLISDLLKILEGLCGHQSVKKSD